MNNLFFKKAKKFITLKDVLNILNKSNKNNTNNNKLLDVNNIKEAKSNEITFFNNLNYEKDAKYCKASVCIVSENNITKAFIDDVEKNKLKNYLKFTPFDKKTRVFTYTTDTDGSDNKIKSQKTMISSLADTTNRNTDNNKWNEMYNQLVAYGEQHSARKCNIPKGYIVTLTDNTECRLGFWLDKQRQLYRQGTLHEDRKEKLQQLVKPLKH